MGFDGNQAPNCFGISNSISRIITLVLACIIGLLGVALCVSLFNGLNAGTVYALCVGIVTIVIAVLGAVGAWQRQPLYLLIFIVFCGVFVVLSGIGILLAGLNFDWYGVSVNAIILCFWLAAAYFAFLVRSGK
mmetsp:Transcript_7184/g.30612  ORF Transcript_7184/g.30612 Transcript_7184/m.30612 type:complete len:133 (-) Transcript_7184:1637-2035(-)